MAHDTSASPPRDAEPADDLARFLFLFASALDRGGVRKLVLARPRSSAPGPQRVSVRPLALRGEAHLSFVERHATRDITKNLAIADGLARVHELLLAGAFGHAHLFTAVEEVQLLVGKRGRPTLRRRAVDAPAPAADRAAHSDSDSAAHSHDRQKHRVVDLDRPYLVDLGVTDAQHRLVPAMARKWKQINKFIEVLDHALDASSLKDAMSLRVADFGSGKGYLTFALHDHLRRGRGVAAAVEGIEWRDDMVALGNAAARRLQSDGLNFVRGDVRTHVPDALDVVIALHACDTATDHAIATGIRAGAAIIMCSPCCHKELRPQLLSPHPMRPILKHGVHLGQQAEMLTDGLRALLLDAVGYDTQVFEFVALEHTNKNKMILAVKRRTDACHAENAWQQVRDIKAYYGIRDQCLETLLLADRG